MPKLTPVESVYYAMLNSGELFKLDPLFQGYIETDFELFLKYYKKFNK